MSVKYDVVMRDGRKLLMGGGCFGALNDGHYSRWSLREGVDDEATRELMDRVNNGLPHSMLRFYPNLELGQWPVGIQGNYWTDMQEIVDSLPWMRDMVVIRPAGKFINFLTGEFPADKVMLAVFLMRNIAQMSTMGHAFRLARSNGLTPLQAAVACSVMWVGSAGFGGNRQAGTNYPGEYNFINVYTFGRRSLARLVAGHADWQLSSWQDLNGYRRDQYFWENDLTIRGFAGQQRHRILLDALSINEDDKLFDSDILNREGYLSNRDADEAWFITRCQELQRIWPE